MGTPASTRARRARHGLSVLVVLLTLAGCGGAVPATIAPGQSISQAAALSQPPTSLPPVSSARATALTVPTATASASTVTAPAPTSTATRTPTPASSPSGTGTAAGGTTAALPGEPDPTLTPGATNPAVTQATIGRTICISGWTATVRPPSSYTTGLKRTQIVDYGYADTSLADYEEDHLIPLEIGGAPRAAANLWPEPYTVNLPDGTAVGARVKDRLENALHALVCKGSMSLARAQQLIRVHWIAAWRTYVVGGTAVVPAPAPTPIATVSPRPTTTAPTGTTAGVTIVSLTSPVARGSTAILAAKARPGAACSITVTYKSGPSKASGLVPRTASSAGSVSWSWTIGTNTTLGTWPAKVTCTANGVTSSATKSFVVQ